MFLSLSASLTIYCRHNSLPFFNPSRKHHWHTSIFQLWYVTLLFPMICSFPWKISIYLHPCRDSKQMMFFCPLVRMGHMTFFGKQNVGRQDVCLFKQQLIYAVWFGSAFCSLSATRTECLDRGCPFSPCHVLEWEDAWSRDWVPADLQTYKWEINAYYWGSHWGIQGF